MTRLIQAGVGVLILAGLLFNGSINPHPMRWFLLWCAVLVVAFIRITHDALTWWILGFVAYAALSLSWSLDWREGILSLNTLALLAGLFILLRHSDGWQWTVPWGAAACIVFSAMQPAETFGGMRNENFQAEFLCLMIPLACMGKRVIPCLTAGLAAYILIRLNLSDAKWMGLAGAFAVILLYVGWKARLMAVAGATAALWLIWPKVELAVLRRLELAYDTLVMWLDYPVFGVGIGGFNYAYPLYQERHPDLIDGQTLTEINIYAGATHNEFVQALAVFGLAGFAMLCVIGWMALRRTQNQYAFVAVAVMAGLASVNFPLQNPSTAILGVIALALSCGPAAGVSRVAERQVSHGRAVLRTG